MATTSSNHGGAATATTTITSLPPDILHTHILTKLDGPSLASTACTSHLLQTLCTRDILWRNICNSTWTSIQHPRVQHVISTFPGGHRSFFSDSFPSLHHPTNHRSDRHRPLQISELISAVDIRYKDKVVYSKIVVTNVDHGVEFLFSTFWVDLFDRKETVKLPIICEENDRNLMSSIEDNVTISWIVIDPTRKRAANVSSLRPVLVQPHWVENDIEVRYATVMSDDSRVGGSELVEFRIVAIFGGKEGGELELKDVNLHGQDMDRRCLNGRDSLVILQEAMESNGRRLKEGKRGELERERYGEYVEMKKERRERKMKRERRFDRVKRMFWFTSFMSLFLLVIFLCYVLRGVPTSS